MHDAFSSPFVVPVAAFAMGAVAMIAGAVSQISARRQQSMDRMALLARGVPVADVETLLKRQDDAERAPRSPLRSLGTARRWATVLISTGVGLMLFFVALTVILQERDVLCGAATGLIPLAIGVGFVVDYQLQKRELARFSAEFGAELGG
jgi:uncharacterized membrane protein